MMTFLASLQLIHRKVKMAMPMGVAFTCSTMSWLALDRMLQMRHIQDATAVYLCPGYSIPSAVKCSQCRIPACFR